MSGRRLYRLLFGPRTIALEGLLLLAGLALVVADRVLDAPGLARLGRWLALPFLATLAVSLLVLAPWFALSDRRGRSAGSEPPAKP